MREWKKFCLILKFGAFNHQNKCPSATNQRGLNDTVKVQLRLWVRGPDDVDVVTHILMKLCPPSNALCL